MPLEPLFGHIDSLIFSANTLKYELHTCPFSKIKTLLEDSIGNYEQGFKIIKDGLTNSVIERAKIISQTKPKQKGTLSPDEVIYTIFQELVRSSYGTAERFNSEISALVKSSIRPELYHWLLEIPHYYDIQKTIVFEEGIQFISSSFHERIVDPIISLIELAKNPSIPGTLAHLVPIDLEKSYPLKDGYIVSIIRGEVETPVMWPILCHEMFEIVDKERNIFHSFRRFISEKSEVLPTLDDNPLSNEHWNLEIFMDSLAINSFGPMYAKSLLEYFKRSPYYPTPSHPDASSRLFCTLQLLETNIHPEQQTDISIKCHTEAKQELEQEMPGYERRGDLGKEKKEKLRSLVLLIGNFLQTIKSPSFDDKLKQHVEESADPKENLKDILTKDDAFIPFRDPLLTFDDIRNSIFAHHISLAIDPNILLNVVLASYDHYSKAEHFAVIVDSIRKWSVKQAWNESVKVLKII